MSEPYTQQHWICSIAEQEPDDIIKAVNHLHFASWVTPLPVETDIPTTDAMVFAVCRGSKEQLYSYPAKQV